MITLTITTDEIDNQGFYLDGLYAEHSIESFDVCLKQDNNGDLYLDDYIPFDPSNRINDNNIIAILLSESENTDSFDGSNCVAKDLEAALFKAAIEQLNEIEFR